MGICFDDGDDEIHFGLHNVEVCAVPFFVSVLGINNILSLGVTYINSGTSKKDSWIKVCGMQFVLKVISFFFRVRPHNIYKV